MTAHALPAPARPLRLRLVRWLLALARHGRPAPPPLALPWPYGEDAHGPSLLERELFDRERRWR